MKRVLSLFLCAALCVPIAASAAGGEEYHWFFMPVKDARPVMPPEGVEDPGKDAILIGPDEKKVFLTFDAGYINENVKTVTAVLKEEKVPAAFFILKQVLKENAGLVKEWDEAGFLVCNHTLTHPNCCRISEEELKEQITGLGELCRETIGKDPAPFFRPPEGSYNRDVIRTAASLGYRTVFWSAAYADWDNEHQMEPSRALSLMLSRTHPGALVLLHPTSATNAAILRDYIRTLRAAGYEFGSLSEITA